MTEQCQQLQKKYYTTEIIALWLIHNSKAASWDQKYHINILLQNFSRTKTYWIFHEVFGQNKWEYKEVCTYSFRHLECLQLHCFCFFGVPSFTSTLVLARTLGDSGFLNKGITSISKIYILSLIYRFADRVTVKELTTNSSKSLS